MSYKHMSGNAWFMSYNRKITFKSVPWPDINPLDYLWGHLKTLVYAVEITNEEKLHQRIVDACKTIRNRHGIFERVRQSVIRRVHACIETGGGHFEHSL
ncbi:hypothetical protein ACS0PU_002729 [Formica fusca]